MEKVIYRNIGGFGSYHKCSCCGRTLPSNNFIENEETIYKTSYGSWGRTLNTTEYKVKKYLCLDCYYYMKPIKKKFNIAICVVLCMNLLTMGTSFFYYRLDNKVYLWWIGILAAVTWLIWAIREIYSNSKSRNCNKDNPVCLHKTPPSVSKKMVIIKGCLSGLFSIGLIVGIIVGVVKCNSNHKKEIDEWNNNVHVTMIKSGKTVDIPNKIFYKEHPGVGSNVCCFNDTKKVLAIYDVDYSYGHSSGLSLQPYVRDIIMPGEYFPWDKEGEDYFEFTEAPYSRAGTCSPTVHVVTYINSLPKYVEIPDSIRQIIKNMK